MGAQLEVTVEVETATDVWTDLSDDVMASEGLSISYGIPGDKPLDTVASTGQCTFTVNGNKYSFHHADVLSGWAFGARIRVIFNRTTDTAQSVSSITRSSSTATVTTAASHGYSTDDWITIAGCTSATTGYNGTFQITKTAATTFTYSVGSLTPATPATGTVTARLSYIKHNGKLRAANPQAGAYKTRKVDVVSYDGIRDLAETDIREVLIQIDKTETELLTAILDSLPSTAQPLDRNLAVGVDTYPYAFNELGAGRNALSVTKDIAVSAFATVFMTGDGTLTLQSRHTRSSGASQFHFNNTMHGLETNASVDELVNNVRTSIQPRTVDAARTTVLYSTTGTPLSIDAGDTLTMSVEYRDPDETKVLIGGSEVYNATATTDYLGYPNIDGTGTNLTTSLAVVTTQYASTATLAITNNSDPPVTIYLVDTDGDAFLQLRGKGVYQKSTQTFEALSDKPYGDKSINIDLKYQSSPTNAQSYALVVEENYNDHSRAQLNSIVFHANDSNDFLLQALQREPGDIISVSETNVGAGQIDMVIQSISLDVSAGPWMTTTYGLAPAAAFAMWKLGDETRSKLGQTTVLGF